MLVIPSWKESFDLLFILQAFKSVPDIINSNEELMKLKETLELALLEAQQESALEQTIVNKHNLKPGPSGENRWEKYV